MEIQIVSTFFQVGNRQLNLNKTWKLLDKFGHFINSHDATSTDKRTKLNSNMSTTSTKLKRMWKERLMMTIVILTTIPTIYLCNVVALLNSASELLSLHISPSFYGYIQVVELYLEHFNNSNHKSCACNVCSFVGIFCDQLFYICGLLVLFSICLLSTG